MQDLDLTLIEWPEGRDQGGPRLLGTITDPDLVSMVRSRLAAQRRLQLARLSPAVRPVPDSTRDKGEAA